MAIPSPILFEEPDNKKVTRVDIDSQVMSGIWNEKLENFSKFSGQYEDIKISQNLRQETLTVKKLDLITDLKENKIGYWSGPTKFGLSGISFGKPDTPRLFYADTLKLGVTIEDFSPTAQKEALKEIEESVEKSEKDEAGDEEDETPSLFLNLLQNSGKSVNFQGVIKGLEINTPSTAALAHKKFALESGSFIIDMRGMQEGILSNSLKIAYRGLQSPGKDYIFHELMPTTFQTHIALNNLPVTELFNAAIAVLPEQDKKSKQIAALQTMITLPHILSKAESNLTISETKYKNSTYEATLNGKLEASRKSLIGVIGDFTLRMSGLDALIQKLESKAETSTPAERKQLDSALKQLNFLLGISQKQDDEYVCNINIGEKAKITINGASISEIRKNLKGLEKSEQVTE